MDRYKERRRRWWWWYQLHMYIFQTWLPRVCTKYIERERERKSNVPITTVLFIFWLAWQTRTCSICISWSDDSSIFWASRAFQRCTNDSGKNGLDLKKHTTYITSTILYYNTTWCFWELKHTRTEKSSHWLSEESANCPSRCTVLPKKYDTKNRQHVLLMWDTFIDWLLHRRTDWAMLVWLADASYVQDANVRVCKVTWQMYRTHRCSVHVASMCPCTGTAHPCKNARKKTMMTLLVFQYQLCK